MSEWQAGKGGLAVRIGRTSGGYETLAKMNHVANSAAAYVPPARVIDGIHDAVLDASGWPDAVA